VKESQWKQLEANINLFKDKINENRKNSQNFKSNKLLIDSKTVVLDQNANSLFEIYKYLKLKLRIDTHSFQFLKGSPIQHADFSFEYNKIFENSLAYEYKNFDSILEQLEKVREFNIVNNYTSFTHPKYIDLNSKISIYDQNYEYFNITKHDQNNYKLCQAPWESMHINVDGAVYPCLAVELGNIKKNTLKEIFFGQKYELFKTDLIKNKTFQACNRCGYLRIHS
jgi:MoaA/NifB/PqqE/SkfB family radical SAM enzyme